MVKINGKMKSSIKTNANLHVRDSVYALLLEYDYATDETKLIIPEKLRLLPRIHTLDFLKDAQNLINEEYYQRLNIFTNSEWSESEIKHVKESKHAIEKRKVRQDI
tara:strand:- start:341 stop:658 length:318 start_codon:yes stop_codon:yes gene_type:complete